MIFPPATWQANSTYRSHYFPVSGVRQLALHFTSSGGGSITDGGTPMTLLLCNAPDTSGAVPGGVARGDTTQTYWNITSGLPGSGNYSSANALQVLATSQRFDIGGAVIAWELYHPNSSAESGGLRSGCLYRFAQVRVSTDSSMTGVSCMAYGLYSSEVTGYPLTNSVTIGVDVATDGTFTLTSGSLSSVPIGAIVTGNALITDGLAPGNATGTFCVRLKVKTSNTAGTLGPWTSGTLVGDVTFVW